MTSLDNKLGVGWGTGRLLAEPRELGQQPGHLETIPLLPPSDQAQCSGPKAVMSRPEGEEPDVPVLAGGAEWPSDSLTCGRQAPGFSNGCSQIQGAIFRRHSSLRPVWSLRAKSKMLGREANPLLHLSSEDTSH